MASTVANYILVFADEGALPGDNAASKEGRLAFVENPPSIYRDDGANWVKMLSTDTRLLFSQTSTVIVADTDAETSLVTAGVGSLTVPANTLQVGDVLHCVITGKYSTLASGSAGAHFKLVLGGDVTPALYAEPSLAVSDVYWKLEAWLTLRVSGDSGGLMETITVDYSEGRSGHSGAVFGIDTTADNTFDATITMNIADAANAWESHSAYLELLRPAA